jgi:rare lipoprotein A
VRFGTRLVRAALILLVVSLSGCGLFSRRTAPDHQASAPSGTTSAPSAPGPTSSKKAGAFYEDDGPGEHPPANLDSILDAVPKAEPLRAAANKPYSVFGREYVPQTSLKPFKQRGVASWYGKKFNGAQTSSGEIYDMYAMTAAHPTLPIPSYARVTNLANSRSVIVRVNDRGPFLSERVMDLSYAAAYRLGYVRAGSAQVEVESIDPVKFVPTAVAKNGAPAVAKPASQAPVAEVMPAKPAAKETVVETDAAVSAPMTLAAPASAAPPVMPPPVTQLPIATEASGIYVQLGAFSQRDNAEAFRTRVYQRLDWLNDTIHISIGGGLYRLHLGPYRDRAEAERMAQRIQNALELKPTLVVK